MGPATSSTGDRGVAERNVRVWEDQRSKSKEMLDEGQLLGSSEEGDVRINEVAKNVDNQAGGAILVNSDKQKAQRQLEGPVIHWDRFLPTRSLKVLLVENDDSTRYVLSALLQNCSYEVTAVADGFQAWKILKDVTHHIDLVLTEVVMPLISGIGLLCKIMSHKSSKNIPVIMMSPHGSMGIVFKCLSKGAVDFLVKPIRKNELKNLWQHVWRRCQSSRGSASESGTQTRRSRQSKSNDNSENNTGSSDECDNVSIGLSVQDGSDDGSGAQSSWTKKAAEVDSPQPTLCDQLADAPDGTSTQVIRTKLQIISNRCVHNTEVKEFQEKDEVFDNVAMGKNLKIGASGKLDFQLEYQLEQFSTHPTSKRQNKLPEVHGKPFDKEQMEDNRDNFSSNKRHKAAEKDSAINSCTIPHVENRAFKACNGFSDTPATIEKAGFDSRDPPSLELSLKTLRESGDFEINALDGHNVLRHSEMSAFSRYTTPPSTYQAPIGNVESCSLLDSSSFTMKTETVHNYPPQLSNTLLNQQSNEGTINNVLAFSKKHVIPIPESFSNKSESMSALERCHSTALQPLQKSYACPPQKVKSERGDDIAVNVVQAQSRSSRQQLQVQHHHHHYHLYHHHVYDVQQQDPDDLLLKTMAAVASQCGSSNAIDGDTMRVNAGNNSGNGSASGSNSGSNGQKGSSTALNAGVIKMELDNAIAENSRVGGVSGKTCAEEGRLAQRKAALTKFRQKRKERCFEKKVRYQNRKKLAEQRPRIRGQFVRQMVVDAKAGHNNRSNDLMSDDNYCDSAQ